MTSILCILSAYEKITPCLCIIHGPGQIANTIRHKMCDAGRRKKQHTAHFRAERQPRPGGETGSGGRKNIFPLARSAPVTQTDTTPPPSAHAPVAPRPCRMRHCFPWRGTVRNGRLYSFFPTATGPSDTGGFPVRSLSVPSGPRQGTTPRVAFLTRAGHARRTAASTPSQGE